MVKSRFSSSISSSILQRADRVERAGRLVEQDHLRAGGDGAGDAQPLLLPARQAGGGGGQAVLHLRPQRGAGERPFDPLVHLGAAQPLVQLHAEGDVVVDRHRERRRLLEHHADAAAQLVQVHGRVEDVLAVHHHLPGRALPGIQVVHPVQHPQQGGFAAAGGADHPRHLAVRQIEADRLQRPVGAVEEIEPLDRDPRRCQRGHRARLHVRCTAALWVSLIVLLMNPFCRPATCGHAGRGVQGYSAPARRR